MTDIPGDIKSVAPFPKVRFVEYATQEDYARAEREVIDTAEVVIVDGLVIKNRNGKHHGQHGHPVETFDSIIQKIDQWGRDRNIIGGGTTQAQFLKLVEEHSEIFTAKTIDEKMDGIGDTIVVATMIAGIEGFTLKEPKHDLKMINSFKEDQFVLQGYLANAIARNNKPKIQEYIEQLMEYMSLWANGDGGLNFVNCIQMAYDEIKDRQGVLFEGVFIKASDTEAYRAALAKLGRVH